MLLLAGEYSDLSLAERSLFAGGGGAATGMEPAKSPSKPLSSSESSSSSPSSKASMIDYLAMMKNTPYLLPVQ